MASRIGHRTYGREDPPRRMRGSSTQAGPHTGRRTSCQPDCQRGTGDTTSWPRGAARLDLTERAVNRTERSRDHPNWGGRAERPRVGAREAVRRPRMPAARWRPRLFAKIKFASDSPASRTRPPFGVGPGGSLIGPLGPQPGGLVSGEFQVSSRRQPASSGTLAQPRHTLDAASHPRAVTTGDDR